MTHVLRDHQNDVYQMSNSTAYTHHPQTLDWVYYLGLAPPRFAGLSGLEQYFAMARGTDDIQLALDMSKYFDTNYRAQFAVSHSVSNPSKQHFAMAHGTDDIQLASWTCSGNQQQLPCAFTVTNLSPKP